jgi:Cu(I)/Ag(I) efflux system membrane protein CusA/SilA
MIEKIIEFSCRNKFFVIMMTLVALVGSYQVLNRMPLDAIPDLSDTQVIIYSKWDRSPDIIEDQVTYPIVTALLGAPKIKTIRGVSDFGYSYVYVIFEDGTDLYWARSRIVEYLNKISSQLPAGVRTEIGPDATSVGWVFQYTLVDESKKLNLAELRTIQDWTLRFHLQALPGVSEVASIGGFVKQYQVNVNPHRLQGYGVSLSKLVEAIKKGNQDTGGRVIEISGTEYMVRGRGYAKSIEDIENIVVTTDEQTHVPILVKHLARVQLGPDMRRGVTDFNGMGDAVGGIVIMRQGENALNVIDRVKTKLKELEPSLPPGVKVIPVYDRSGLINRAISTLKSKVTTEVIIVSLVILLFLWHIPSAIVPILTIPISIFLAFIPLYFMGVTTNIMSLAGIAISIGVLVDGAIVEVENAYKKLELWNSGGRIGDFHEVRLNALKEVGPSVFFSLLVITVSFLPVFTLVDQEGRLFSPLAISKTMTMALAAILALTLDPALRMLFSRMDDYDFKPRWLCRIANHCLVGKYYPEEDHPVSRTLYRWYNPICEWVLGHAKQTIVGAGLLILLTVPIYMRLGSEFMPPLSEGDFLYMPTAFPGMSVTEAQRIVQRQDAIIKSFGEVQTVFGKAGRAETATDPAPFSMLETTVMLKPVDQWPAVDRWYSVLPEILRKPFYWITPPHRSMEELRTALDEKLRFAGIPNIWTMPIKNRIDMLSTGIRTPVGIKVMGPDLQVIQKISEEIEGVVRSVSGTTNVFAERTSGGYYLDFKLKREELARYGISVEDAQMIISSAIGGEVVSNTIEGRSRFGISVRYAREFREDISALEHVMVPSASGVEVPMAQIAEIKMVEGPAMIRNENGLLAGFVYIDVKDRDIGGYVEEAKKLVESKVHPPTGYSLVWSGQYENMLRVEERLKVVVPITLLLIMLLLYLNTKSWVKTGIVMLAVPFSLIGAFWLLWMLGYNLSIAVWVGMIALMGLDAETGVFMLMYLDHAFDDQVREKRMNTLADLREAIIHGAVKRIRPKMMTVMAAFMGLTPIMFSMGTGSDVMKRIAAPMVGGLISSFALELLVYPAIFYLWKQSSMLDHTISGVTTK